MAELGLPVAGFAEVARQGDIYSALAKTGRPAILKTRRLGYDGKGQAVIRAGDDPRLGLAGDRRGAGDPEIVRRLRARGVGDRRPRPRRHAPRLRRRGKPARWRDPRRDEGTGGASACNAPRRPSPLPVESPSALDHVGVLAVEMFVIPAENEKRLLVNEIAPRVHNSGHWTSDACLCSQFEQHIRAICGWPLGDPARHSDAVMTNLIGDAVTTWPALAADRAPRLHLYGKADTSPGRKMGHVTRLKPRLQN